MTPIRHFIAAALMVLSAPALATTTIISVTGPTSATSPSFSTGGGAMVEFTVASALTNVSIYADDVCISCDGQAFLLTDFGPSATLSDVVQLGSFDANTSPLLTLSSLDAGTYYFVLASTSGGFQWNATESPTFGLVPGATVGPSFVTESFDSSVPFNSTFSILADQNLLFRITADSASAVPEPGTWLLLVIGFGGIGLVFRATRGSPSPTRFRLS